MGGRGYIKAVSHVFVVLSMLSLSTVASFATTLADPGGPPIAVDDAATALEDTPTAFDVMVNDLPSGSQFFFVDPPIVCPMVFGVPCLLPYDPPRNFCGTDTVPYTISNGAGMDTATLTVTVTCAPDPPTDITLSAAAVGEDQPSGTVVGTLGTVDPDVADTFAYTLAAGAGDADNASFAIAGGSLLTNASFDYETKSTFSIRVRSTDAGALFVDKVFSITVADAASPAVATLGVESLSTAGARLTGTVNPGGAPTTAWFEWGTDPALAPPYTTAPDSLGAGTGTLPVTATLGGLTPGVTYYYRVAAENGEGIARGAIDYFSPDPADITSIVVNSLDDPETAPPGKLTLREAIARLGDDGVIRFDPVLDGARIDLTVVGETDTPLRGEVFTQDPVTRKWVFGGYQARNYGASALFADKSLTIDASNLPHGITLAWAGGASSHARVLAVLGNLTLNRVTVTGGYAAAVPLSVDDYPTQPFTLGRGGGIAVWGTAALTDCVVGGNLALGDLSGSRDRGAFGGGIYADTVALNGCVVSGNAVRGYGASGGGVFSVGGVETYRNSFIGRSAITGNRVTGQHAYGGGVYSDGGGPGNINAMEIADSTIARNLVEDNPDIDQSTMSQFYYRGGGFYMSNGCLQLAGSTVVENAVVGHPYPFSGKPNMGGGGIAATIGNAHVVEDMDIRHSIVAGNTLVDVDSDTVAAGDVFTGSLLHFYSSGYNLFGHLDFRWILVPVPSWDSLSRRHFPKANDLDGVAVGEVLDLARVRRHEGILSVGVDAGEHAVLWYPPRGVALDRVPGEDYTVPNVVAGYSVVSDPPVDDFPNLVLEKLRTDYPVELGSDFGVGWDLSKVIWYEDAYIWPSDPRNADWIKFWRDIDAAVGVSLGAAGLADDFWSTFTAGPFGDNLLLSVFADERGPVPRSDADQRGTSRFDDGRGDAGAIELRPTAMGVVLSPPTIGTLGGSSTLTVTLDTEARQDLLVTLAHEDTNADNPGQPLVSATPPQILIVMGSKSGQAMVRALGDARHGTALITASDPSGAIVPCSATVTVNINPPLVVALVSPSGVVATATPTYTWNAQAGVDSYLLWVGKGASTALTAWYTAAAAGCGAGEATCSATPATALGPGSWFFNVKGKNAVGTGPWAASKGFAIAGTPTALTLLSPSGVIGTTTPTYTWMAQAGADSYQLWAGTGTSTVLSVWYSAAAAGCPSGGTCSVTPALTLGAGTWYFNVKARNFAGTGPWTASKGFTIGTPPTALSLLSPSGPAGTATPTYTWNARAGVDSYLLWVGTGSTTKVSAWYTAAAAGCASGTGTCAVTPASALAAGTWYFNVKGGNAAGIGPWTVAKGFTTP